MDCARDRDGEPTIAQVQPALDTLAKERRAVIATIVVTIVVVIACGVTSLRAVGETREARRWVDHTHRVLAAIADTRDGMHAAAAATRGYLLTGDERFVRDFAPLRPATTRDVDELQRLTADMPPQQERVARLGPLIADRLDVCARQIDAERAGDAAAGIALIARASAIDRDVERVLGDMRTHEEALLAERDAASAASSRRTALFLELTSIAALAIGLTAGPLVLLQMRRRERAERALVASHADLERQVAARTRELSESRERLALAQSVAGIGSFDWHLESGRIVWSPELEALFGLPPDRFGGTYAEWMRMVAPEDLPMVEAAARDAIERGKRLDIEFRIRRADDGSERWIRAVGSLVAGRRLLGVNIDVTAAKRANDELAASERRYRFLAESMPQVVWTAAPDGAIEYLNQVFAEYHGADIGAHLGEAWTRALHPDDVAATVERWRQSLATGEDYSAEFRVRRADGAWRWQLARARAQRDERGAIIRWYGSSTDIQDQKEHAAELEREVAERTRELRAAIDELESFSYSVSHDLRTPLRAIEGFADALAEDHGAHLDGPGHDHLRRIRAAARRMGEIIDALLGLSRLGRSRLALQPVDIGAIARQVLADLARQEPDRRVATRVGECTVMGDAALLLTAFENLLDNAWKFTRDVSPARIEVACTAMPGGRIAIRVADNGAGFPPEAAPKLFHAFKRFHDPARFPGSGIGLATVRRIVERHGGEIRAEGSPGHGASFIVTLPAAAPTPSHEHEPAEVG